MKNQQQKQEFEFPRDSNQTYQLKLKDSLVHLQSQIDPYRIENHDLKNTILASATYLEQQRQNLGLLLRERENIEIIRKVADIPKLLSYLKKDLDNLQLELTLKQTAIDSLQIQMTDVINQGNDKYGQLEREYEQIKSDLTQKLKQKETQIEANENLINQLQAELKKQQTLVLNSNENLQIKIQAYEQHIAQLLKSIDQKQDREQNIIIKNRDELISLKDEHSRLINKKQELFEASLGELRYTHKRRIEKMLRDNDIKYQDQQKQYTRLKREFDQMKQNYELECAKNTQNQIQIQSLQVDYTQTQELIDSYKKEAQQKQMYLHQAQSIITNLKKEQTQEYQSQLSSKHQNKNSINDILDQNFVDELNNLQQQYEFPQKNIKQSQQSQQQQQQQQQQYISKNIQRASFYFKETNQTETNQNQNPLMMQNQSQNVPSWVQNDSDIPDEINLTRNNQRVCNDKRACNSFLQISEDDQRPFLNQSTNLIDSSPRSNILKRLRKKKQCRNRQKSQDSEIIANISKTTANTQKLHTTFRIFDKIDFPLQKNFDNETQIRENENAMNNSNFIEKNKTYATNNSPKLTQASPNQGAYTENMHKFSLQLLQSEQDDNDYIGMQKQINQLKEEIERKDQLIQQIQNASTEMETNIKDNMQCIKQQVDQNQKEGKSFLKKFEKYSDFSKKKQDVKVHLQQQINKGEQLEQQLFKAVEIIKYFNLELENYKKTYNLFTPTTQKINKNRLPNIGKLNKLNSLKSQRKPSNSLYEEAQFLITNLYDVRQGKRIH